MGPSGLCAAAASPLGAAFIIKDGHPAQKTERPCGGQLSEGESIVAIIAALIAKANNIVTDITLVAVIGYLLAMDYRSRHGRC
jgi:hypothetical protein